MKIQKEELGWRIPLLIAKIQTLYGNCHLELGQMKEAYLCFSRAMILYGKQFNIRQKKCFPKFLIVLSNSVSFI